MPRDGTLKDELMRTGMMALALGLLALRFLPVLPPVWLWLSMPVAGLMLLPFKIGRASCRERVL